MFVFCQIQLLNMLYKIKNDELNNPDWTDIYSLEIVQICNPIFFENNVSITKFKYYESNV